MWLQIVEVLKKPFAKFILILAATIFIIGALWKIPQWQTQGFHGKLDATAINKLDSKDLIQLQKDLITAENNARQTLAQIIGGLVVLLGLYATFKNVQIAQNNLKITEEGKLTDRFSKAVELIGSESRNVRIGGIYALERIARDSQKDHWTVMEVLTAYIRDRTSKLYIDATRNPDWYNVEKFDSKPSADIQAALNVIARRKWFSEEKPDQQLDLTYAYLEGAKLNNAQLSRVNLTGAVLNNAELMGAHLEDARFDGCYLNSTIFYKANLRGAGFVEANLRHAQFNHANLSMAGLTSADFSDARLWQANLEKAILHSANLSEAKGLTWEQIQRASLFESTLLPPDLEEIRKKIDE